MSWFAEISSAPAIEVFALTQAFNEDSYPQKVNLSVGGECFSMAECSDCKVKLRSSERYWDKVEQNPMQPHPKANIFNDMFFASDNRSFPFSCLTLWHDCHSEDTSFRTLNCLAKSYPKL